MTNTATGDVCSVKKVGLFKYVVNAKGESPAQSWKQNVGLANYARLFSEGNLAPSSSRPSPGRSSSPSARSCSHSVSVSSWP